MADETIQKEQNVKNLEGLLAVRLKEIGRFGDVVDRREIYNIGKIWMDLSSDGYSYIDKNPDKIYTLLKREGYEGRLRGFSDYLIGKKMPRLESYIKSRKSSVFQTTRST